MHIRWFPRLSFFHRQSESIYPMVSECACPMISSDGFLGAKPMVSWASLFLDWQSECAYPMVAWVELFEIGNPNVHISMFPGLFLLRLGIRICSSIFVEWQSECAYPMVSWVYLF